MTRRLSLLLPATVLAVFWIVANGSESTALAPRFCIPAENVFLGVAAAPRLAAPGERPSARAEGAACPSGIARPDARIGEDADGFNDLLWAEWIVPEDHFSFDRNAPVLMLSARDPDGAPRRQRHDGAEDRGWGVTVAALSESLLLSRPPPVGSPA